MVWKILIADESDAIRSIAVNLFRQCGCELLTASGGSEAWEILKSGKIDLAILNSDLSGMDGYTISKLIKEDDVLAVTKTLLMLSPSEIVNQHQLITAQPDSTLNKPFAPPDLLEKAGQVLNEDFQLPDNYNESDLSDSVSAMELTEEEIANKIDFTDIFDTTGSTNEIGDIHLSGVLDSPHENVADLSDDISESLVDDDAQTVEDTAPPGSPADSENVIRLAEDQYGLEEPFDSPEIERPHDYNWFISEMKNEIKGKGSAKNISGQFQGGKFPKKPDTEYTVDDMDTTGHFSISEIGADDMIEPQSKPSAVDELDKMISKASQKDNSKVSSAKSDTRLNLAEKLLVQELARRLAEQIISQIPRKKLQNILDQVFNDLKKC